VVDRSLLGDVQCEGHQTSLRIESLAGSPKFEEHFLDDILNLIARDESTDIRTHQGAVFAIAKLDRSFVTTTESGYESGVGANLTQTLNCLHTSYSRPLGERLHEMLSRATGLDFMKIVQPNGSIFRRSG